MYAYVKCSSSHAQNTLQPCHQLVKLRVMTIIIKLARGSDQIWNFRDDMCRIESQKAMKCVPFAVNVCLCEMFFLTCSEHTSIMSPLHATQDYDY